MGNRVEWADQVKAICIILMVFCHAGCVHGHIALLKFIYIFHMPLFFFISGYFDKGKFLSFDLLKKRSIQLLVPYFIWGLAAFSTCWSGPLFHPDVYNTYSLVSVFTHGIIGLLLMQNDITPYSYLTYGPLWFLPALFFTKVVFSLCRDACLELTHINKLGGVIISIIILVAFTTDTNLFSIKSALLALPIYALGFLCKKYNLIDRVTKKSQALLLAIAGFSYTLTLGMINSKISMDRADFGDNILLFYVDAIVAILALIFLLRAIQIRSRLLSYIGAATLPILVTHLYAVSIKTIITIKVLHYSAGSEPFLYSLMAALIGVAVGLICNMLCLKYFPLAIGKGRVS